MAGDGDVDTGKTIFGVGDTCEAGDNGPAPLGDPLPVGTGVEAAMSAEGACLVAGGGDC